MPDDEHGGVDAVEEHFFSARAMGQKQPWRAYYFCGLHELEKKDPIQPYAHRDGDPTHTPEEYQEHPELIYVPQRGDVIREAAIVAVPGDYGTPDRHCFFIYCDVCTTQNTKGHRVRVHVDELQKKGFYKPCDNPDKNPDLRRHEVYVPAKQYVWPMLADDREPSALRCCINRGVGQFAYIREEIRRWLSGGSVRLVDVHEGKAKQEQEYSPFPPLRERLAQMPWRMILKIVVVAALVIGGGIGAYYAFGRRAASAATDRSSVYTAWETQLGDLQKLPDKGAAVAKARALLEQIRNERTAHPPTPENSSLLWRLEDQVGRFVEGK